jgi:aspartyl-tRNA(Asn)/glutamyl-tRNA(Gln) amidotransferase subunit C
MSVSKEEFESLSQLARLKLSESEKTSLRGDLDGILEHMRALSEVDTQSVAPMTHVGHNDESSALRSDEVLPSLPQKEVLSAAHHHEDGCFVVPSILPTQGAGS